MSKYLWAERSLVINGCVLRNRIVRAAHGTLYATNGIITQRLIDYHEARGAGGVALTILEAGGVHPTWGGTLHAFSDENIAPWGRLAERCHAQGMRVFQQLFHAGATTGHSAPAPGPAWSPSATPNPGSPTRAVAMSSGMIEEMVESFATAAVRCKIAGLDGVEIHAAHGYLIHEFLSPLTNRRIDQYGGPLENRMRFLREVLGAARQALGADYPLGIRLSGSESYPGGMDAAEATTVAARLEAEGLIDFLDLSLGSYFQPHKMFGAMHEPGGYQLQINGPIAKAVRIPTIVSGRIATLAQAEEILKTGRADLVSLVRATIADPALVGKSFAGRENEVLPCIGCNQYCVGMLALGQPLACTVNPEVGRERVEHAPDLSINPRRILVIGAGPAGLQAARVAARRGHVVMLCEASPNLGGQVRIARKAPYRHDIGRICDFLGEELARLGVNVQLNKRMDLAACLLSSADRVVVATGAVPSRDGLQRFRPIPLEGVDLPHVMGVTEALSFEVPRGARALVYDDLGTYHAPGVAEYLLENGAQVTLASSDPMLGGQLAPSFQQAPTIQRLSGYERFRFIPRQLMTRITPQQVSLSEIGVGVEHVIDADWVVLATGFEPMRDLYDELLSAGVAAHLVGDAFTPADIGHAIAEATRVGMAI